jgi:hypothetical protein
MQAEQESSLHVQSSDGFILEHNEPQSLFLFKDWDEKEELEMMGIRDFGVMCNDMDGFLTFLYLMTLFNVGKT